MDLKKCTKAELIARCKGLEVSCRKLNEALAKKQDSVERNERQKQKLKKMAEDANASKDIGRDLLHKKEDVIAHMNRHITKLCRSVASQKGATARMKKQRDKWASEVARLGNQVSDLCVENRHLQIIIDEKNEQLHEERIKTDNLIGARKAIEVEYEELKAKHEDAVLHAEDMVQECCRMEGTISEQKEIINEYRTLFIALAKGGDE